MPSHRGLSLNFDNEPLWVGLDVRAIGDRWAAMLLADANPLPESGTVKGLTFFEATAEKLELAGQGYLGCAEPAN